MPGHREELEKSMRHSVRKTLILLAVLAAVIPAARAAEGEFIEVGTYEQLLQIAADPSGSYRLTDDIDMAGRAWEPVDFSGVFDGGGHALLNLEVNSTGAGLEDTYDGNYKVYGTRFAGLFGALKGAEVSDLALVNVKVKVETDEPCFIGSIAGYAQDSVIRSCQVQGRLELTAHDRMFGVGGIVGYGSGLIQDTQADMTLICTDTDAETRDEQFMGGAYAAGYLDLEGCRVTVDGYDSDHGYVHNGGLIGMYIFYPRGLEYEGRITDNTVEGKITFFEDNTDRRAYCKGFIGEVMNWNFVNSGNREEFLRDEVFDYSVDLKPDPCTGASYTRTVTEPGCGTFGYTTIQCDSCGYAYTDDYTPCRHQVSDWTVTRQATEQETGLREGACALCGAVQTEEIEKLPPQEVTPPPEPAAEEPSGSGGGDRAPQERGGGSLWVPAAAAGAVLLFRRGKRR